MRNWIEPQEIPIPDELMKASGGDKLIAGRLAQLGIRDEASARAFLSPDEYIPTPASELPDIEKAAERIESAIEKEEPICAWGDFDVDGQTATTILVDGLGKLGAKVSYHIPVRDRESHGVNVANLKPIIENGAKVVVTCDTGISAHEAADYAKSQGIDFIVTDHHQLPERLPAAYALVDPKRLPEGHRLGTLPGAGVAYKVIEYLYERQGRAKESEQFLDLVALGITADLATLYGEARYLLQRGIQALRNTERTGLKVMMGLIDLNPTWLTEEHIGFMLGPRLNALGRLDDANPIVDFFLTSNEGRARMLANHIEGLNARRKYLTSEVLAGATAQIERDPGLLKSAALVLSHPDWEAGVIGIVANDLVEQYNRPVILLSAPEGKAARGSARSVAGCDITAAIATQKDLLIGFGGHAMAAGLAIDPENIAAFRNGLSKAVRQALGEIPPIAPLQIDQFLPLQEITFELVDALERLAPFGPGNPALTFAARDLRIESAVAIGRNEEHMQVIAADAQGNTQRLIWWRGEAHKLPEGRFDLAFHVRASNFRGLRDVQAEWVDARRIIEPQFTLKKSARELVDCRKAEHPLPLLKEYAAEADTIVWREGTASKQIEGCDRFHVQAAKTLIVWSIPPRPAELREVIRTVDPRRIVAFGVEPGYASVDAFVQGLAGMVKYALKNNISKLEIPRLAALTAQTGPAVQRGLHLLAQRGIIEIANSGEDEVKIKAGANRQVEDSSKTEAALRSMLEETAAYRDYYMKADLQALFGE